MPVTAPMPRKSLLLLALAVSVTGCAGVGTKAKEAGWPPLAQKWFDRAEKSYGVADIEDADLAIDNAVRLLPSEPRVKLLAGRIALAQLEYDACLEHLAGLADTDARAVRGRAYWYSGALDEAADELDQLLSDPEVRDPWARDIAKLARRGTGRKPFSMSGALLAVTDMPKTGQAAMIVPLEVNGEQALGLIATGVPEAVVDSSAGAEASWISLRFDGRVEVRDVPALAKDLSGISRQLNAPIKVLLGVNVLRHLNTTFDFAGGQFVVRSFEPPPPPHATTVRVDYLLGGGMVMRSAFGSEENAPVASLLVDTAMTFPLALDAAGWKKAGVAPRDLAPFEGSTSMKQGVLPMMHLGAFEIPGVPGVLDDSVKAVEDLVDVDLDGAVGAGLLAAFRTTMTAKGRTLWLEDMPAGALSDGPYPDGPPPPPEEPAPGAEAPAPPPPGAAVPPAPRPGAATPPLPGAPPGAGPSLPGMPALTPPQLTPPRP